MNRVPTGLLIILVSGLVVFGCSKREQGSTAEPAPSVTAAGPADAPDPGTPSAPVSEDSSAPAPAPDNSMAASVNGKEITRSDVDRATAVLFSQYRDRIPPERMEQAKVMLRNQALENLINKNLLMQEADREGIQVDQQAADTDFKKISDRFPNPEEFRKALTTMGVSDQDLRSEVRDNLKVEKLLDKDMAGLKKPGGEEVDAFYREHSRDFQKPERVRASHILISTAPDDTAEVKAQKRQKLSGLQGQVKQKADFAQLARENSDCPSKSQGGDLGYFERGKMVKAFDEVAFQMKPGEVSDIVETEFGYHLIKVDDHQQAGTIPLEEARGDITSFLEQQNRQKAMESYLQKLRGAAKVEYAAGMQPAPMPPPASMPPPAAP